MNNELDNDLKELEKHLAELSPTSLSEDMLSRMEDAMTSWEIHLPVEEKIIPFQPISENIAEEQPEQKVNNKSHFPVWSAAAAVALMGAVGAVFMQDTTTGDNNAPIAFNQATPNSSEITAASLPKHFSHNLTNASNAGITYAGNDQPYKVIKIEYTKDVTSKDKAGKETTRKEPTFEFILLPVEAH